MDLFEEILAADDAVNIRSMVRALPLQGEGLAEGVAGIIRQLANQPEGEPGETTNFLLPVQALRLAGALRPALKEDSVEFDALLNQVVELEAPDETRAAARDKTLDF